MPSLDKIHLFILKKNGSGINRTHEYLDVIHGVRTLKMELDRQFAVSIPPDEPCIVVDDLPNIEQKRFVEYLSGSVLLNPAAVYTYAGLKFEGVKDGTLSRVQKFTRYNRMPFTPRYRKNDAGPVSVDTLEENVFACSAGILVDIIDALSGSKVDKNAISVAISKLGLALTCIDPAIDWSGLPRQNAANDGTMKMDSGATMQLFTHRGWHEGPYTGEATRDPGKVAVIITTHNRTGTAKLTIESLVRRIKYPSIEWIIADDRSERGHLDSLVDFMKELGVENVMCTETSEEHWGLGASLNNALHAAFNMCDVVLTTEDDWYLQHDLDLAPFVELLSDNKNVAAIRLGAMFKADDHLPDSSIHGFNKVTNGSRFSSDKTRMLLNLQVALRHKRLYDALGFYAENRKPDDVESNMNERFCSYTNEGLGDDLVVLWPSDFEKKTLDSRINPFVHFGESTCGHDYAVPAWLDGKTRICEIGIPGQAAGESPTIHVAMVSDRNGWIQLDKVVRSIRKTNAGNNVKIHVVAYDDKLAACVKNKMRKDVHGVSVEVAVLSKEDKNRIEACATPQSKTKYSVPPVGLVKFMLGRYVDVPKVIYIDTDTLVRKPLKELYDTDLEGNAIGAVVDPGCLFLAKDKFPLISGNKEYFNSGVMLLDLDKIRDGGFESVLFHRKKMQPNLLFQDQDVLNAEFFRYTKLLHPKFNVLMGAVAKVCSISDLNQLYGTEYADVNAIIDDAVIWHWASGDKPWMSRSATRASTWMKM